MLAKLLSVPYDKTDWDVWSLHNREEIDRINQAIEQKFGVNLPAYPLDPINFNQITDWLAYNSQAHIAFNSALNLQSNDLLSVNLRDVRERISWIFTNYQEMLAAQVTLGI